MERNLVVWGARWPTVIDLRRGWAKTSHMSDSPPEPPARSPRRRSTAGACFRAASSPPGFAAAPLSAQIGGRFHPRRRQRRARGTLGPAVDPLRRRASRSHLRYELAESADFARRARRRRGRGITRPRLVREGRGDRARAGPLVLLPLHRARRHGFGNRPHPYSSGREDRPLPHGGVQLLEHGFRLFQRLRARERRRRIRSRGAPRRLFLRVRPRHLPDRKAASRRTSSRTARGNGAPRRLSAALCQLSPRSRPAAAASALPDGRDLRRSRDRERHVERRGGEPPARDRGAVGCARRRRDARAQRVAAGVRRAVAQLRHRRPRHAVPGRDAHPRARQAVQPWRDHPRVAASAGRSGARGVSRRRLSRSRAVPDGQPAGGLARRGTSRIRCARAASGRCSPSRS